MLHKLLPHYIMHIRSKIKATFDRSQTVLSETWLRNSQNPIQHNENFNIICRVFASVTQWFKLKLKTDLYSAIKSEDSEAFDGGTSRLSSQKEYGEIKMFWGGF